MRNVSEALAGSWSPARRERTLLTQRTALRELARIRKRHPICRAAAPTATAGRRACWDRPRFVRGLTRLAYRQRTPWRKVSGPFPHTSRRFSAICPHQRRARAHVHETAHERTRPRSRKRATLRRRRKPPLQKLASRPPKPRMQAQTCAPATSAGRAGRSTTRSMPTSSRTTRCIQSALRTSRSSSSSTCRRARASLRLALARAQTCATTLAGCALGMLRSAAGSPLPFGLFVCGGHSLMTTCRVEGLRACVVGGKRPTTRCASPQATDEPLRPRRTSPLQASTRTTPAFRTRARTLPKQTFPMTASPSPPQTPRPCPLPTTASTWP